MLMMVLLKLAYVNKAVQYLFLSRLACCIMNWQASVAWHIPAYIPTLLNVEADYLSDRDSSLDSLCIVSTLGSTRGGFIGILRYQSRSALLHLESITSGSLQVEHLQPSLVASADLCKSTSCVSSNSSVHVCGSICHRSTQTSNSSCTMLDGGTLASHCSQPVTSNS